MRRPSFKTQRGAELIEFAVTLPVILIILFLIVELGIAVADQAVLANASRAAALAAARSGAAVPCSNNTTCTCDPDDDPAWCAGYRVLRATGGQNFSSLVWWNRADGPKPIISVTPNPATLNPGDQVTATVSYPFQFRFLPAFGIITQNLGLRGTTVMSMMPH